MFTQINDKTFENFHILVIGDIMLDNYIYGHIARISPEAPVPIVQPQSKESRLGGAANVALNIHQLGAKVTLCSIVGDDISGDILKSILHTYRPQLQDQIFTLHNRKTTVKTRILAKNQHILRVDEEDTDDIPDDVVEDILSFLVHILNKEKIQGVIFQDYNKGMLTSKLISHSLKILSEKNIPSFVDPKKDNFWSYINCTVFKPNKKEIMQALQLHAWPEKSEILHNAIQSKLNHTLTLITLSEDGIYYNNSVESGQIKPQKVDIVDVCGAGDAVLAITALGYVSGMDIVDIVKLSNAAGSYVCSQPGVSPLHLRKLLNYLVD